MFFVSLKVSSMTSQQYRSHSFYLNQQIHFTSEETGFEEVRGFSQELALTAGARARSLSCRPGCTTATLLVLWGSQAQCCW